MPEPGRNWPDALASGQFHPSSGILRHDYKGLHCTWTIELHRYILLQHTYNLPRIDYFTSCFSEKLLKLWQEYDTNYDDLEKWLKDMDAKVKVNLESQNSMEEKEAAVNQQKVNTIAKLWCKEIESFAADC